LGFVWCSDVGSSGLRVFFFFFSSPCIKEKRRKKYDK